MNKKIMLVTMLILVLSFGNIYANTSEEQAASDLNELQILKGDGSSLNLEGELTRAEGATFIVRLLGKEEEVIKNKIDYLALDFSDVFGNDWFSPYVGYCVEQGIIDGYSDGTFRASDKLSEQAFVKMILGAMGYEHGVDFKWSETFSFAYDMGVLTEPEYEDMVSNSNPYTRGKVVQLLHHVMSQKDSTGQTLMVDTLIDSSVLTRDQAISYGFIKDPLVMEVSDFKQNNGMTFTVLLNEVPMPLTKENVIVKEKNSDVTLEVTRVLEADIQRMYYITIDDQIPDKEYVFTLTNVQDKQGNVLKDYTYEFFGFRGSDYDSPYYRVARAELQASNMLDITFTQPVDITEIFAKHILIKKDDVPYLLGSNTNMSLQVDGSNPYVLHVELLTSDFSSESIFEVVISKDVKSLYGVNIKDGQEDSARFNGEIFEETSFELVETLYEDSNNIVLVFSKNINETIAEQVFSYYVKKLDDPIGIEKAQVIKSGVNANKAVRLTMEDTMVAFATYVLTINQAYDTSRTESIIEEEQSIVIRTESKPTLVIDSLKSTASNRLEVVLESYLDPQEAMNVSNYSVVDKETGVISRRPSKVYYDKYASMPMVVLEFANKSTFDDNTSYELIISSNMKDDNGSTHKTDVKKTFINKVADYPETTIKKAMYIGNNIVMIKGNTEFALELPNVLNNNYELQYLDGEDVISMEPIGVEYFNEHIILLRFEGIDRDTAYSLKVNGIKTGFGETLDTSSVMTEVYMEEIR